MNKKLHILFLCGWYPSRILPTNGDFIQRHAEAVSLNHNVSIIHIITDKNLSSNSEYTFENINGIDTYIAYIKPVKNPLKKGVHFFKAFKTLLKKVGTFQIVHLNEIYPFGVFCLYLKWFQQKPFIVTEHWTGYHNAKSISFLRKEVSKVIIKNASFTCPVSDDLAKSLKLLGFKGNYKKVPNVVDTKLFKPINESNDIFMITHISNMNNNHKNINGLLKVIDRIQKKIKNFKFQIIGKNSSDYKNYITKLGIDLNKIIFYDQIPHQEVAEKLKKSNLFILFSNYENLPCVILEAFSSGVPVISTDVGGISEYFPNNFGTLIKVRDEEKLEEEIVNFYYEKHKIASKKKMHNYVESLFSKQKIANDFSELYFKSLQL